MLLDREGEREALEHLLGRGRPGYRLDGVLLRALADGNRMLTIRIDLDRG